MQKMAWLLGVPVFLGVLIWWGTSHRTEIKKEAQSSTESLTVVTSFYPLAEFARQVGGDRVMVNNIVPPGTEPHDYEPSPRDIIAVREANLFLFNGAGLDGWAEALHADLEANGVRVTEMAEHVELLPDETDGEDGHAGESDHEVKEHLGEDEHTDEHSAFDPHFWLDPVRAGVEVELIRDTLISLDPAGRSVYEKNAAGYLQQLTDLDVAYKAGLQTCRVRTVVVSHEAFGYLAERYRLETLAIAGLSPEVEPSSQRLVELTELVKRENIQYIFFETLVSPKLAETLAQETGAQTLVFNPIEGLTVEETAAGENYITLMRENLSNLRKALECK